MRPDIYGLWDNLYIYLFVNVADAFDVDRVCATCHSDVDERLSLTIEIRSK